MTIARSTADGGRPLRVAVVGGGVAGLSTAYFLRRQAAEQDRALHLTLFEAAARLGGHVLSEEADGFLLEGGPDCFVSQKPWGVRLSRELGLCLMNTAPAGATYVLSHGRLHALPEGTMLMVPTRFLPLARSRLLSWPGKARMGLDLLLPRGGGDDESLGDFVRRRLGSEALEKIAEPLVAGVHAGDPDRLSLSSTFPRFKEMEVRERSLIVAMIKARRRQAAARRQAHAATAQSPATSLSAFVTLTGGLQSLIQGLAGALPDDIVRLGSPVDRVERCEPGEEATRAGLQVWLKDSSEPGECFDAVVLATPAAQTARVVAKLDQKLADELTGIAAVSAVTVSLAWPKTQVAHPLNGFGLVVPRGEKRDIMGVTWTSSKFPGRAPKDYVLVRAFLGGVKGPEILDLSDREIVSMVRREVGELLGVSAIPRLARLYRWEKAMPQYNVGHAGRLARIEERLTELPGLFLAGGSYRGIGIPDCIQSGRAAASALLEAALPSQTA